MLWRSKIAARYLALLVRCLIMYRYNNMTTLNCDLENVSREPLLLVWNSGTWPSLLRRICDRPRITPEFYFGQHVTFSCEGGSLKFGDGALFRSGDSEFRSASEIARKRDWRGNAWTPSSVRPEKASDQTRQHIRQALLQTRRQFRESEIRCSPPSHPASQRGDGVCSIQVVPGSSQARRLSRIGRAPPHAMTHIIRCKSYTGKKRQESLGGNDHKTMAIQMICVSTAAFSGVVT